MKCGLQRFFIALKCCPSNSPQTSKRWVVGRSFGWFRWCRRLSRDYEYSPQSAESWVDIASIRLLLIRNPLL